jgi:hypothetical protein
MLDSEKNLPPAARTFPPAKARPAVTAGRAVFVFFAAQICAVLFLQRVVIPGLGIEVGVILMPLGIFALYFFAPIQLPLRRAAFYGLLVLLAMISQFTVHAAISTSSFALLLVAYLPFLVEIQVSRETYLRCLSFFQDAMLFVCGVLLLQHAWMVVLGGNSFPKIEDILPANWVIQGFNYFQPLFYGSTYFKPNAFFFKEVSFLSQFLTLAFVVEIVFFMRYWRLALYLACLFSTFAGTGLLMLLLISPFLIIRLPGRSALLIAGLAFAVCLAAVVTGWWDLVGNRVNEFQTADTSGYARFTWPFLQAWSSLSDSSNLLSGLGAGIMERRMQAVDILLAPAKLIIEYGPAVAVAFYAMYINATFVNVPSLRLAAALFVLYNLGGGFLLDLTIVNTVVLLGSILRPPPRPLPIRLPKALPRRFVPGPQQA